MSQWHLQLSPGKRQAASGKVRYRIEWPGLSAEEKSAGFILPWVAHAASDVVIELPL